MTDLEQYVERLASLQQDKNSRSYPAAPLHALPHKPLLLLAVLDLIAEGTITENRIPLDPTLADLFSEYWREVMPPGRSTNLALPFFHLQKDGFWTLLPAENEEAVPDARRKLNSMKKIRERTRGARLDSPLYELANDKDSRSVLRRILVETYFADEVHDALYEIGRVNQEAFKYSQRLLDLIQSNEIPEPPEVDEPVRDRGFRRAVVDAYNHRCAITGLRIVTPDGRSAVDAAHIIPWSVSQNDDLRNGLALSKLTHWVFEHGLLTISDDMTIQLSNTLDTDYNAVGNLSTLDGRSLLLPDHEELCPSKEYLSWHRQEVFLG